MSFSESTAKEIVVPSIAEANTKMGRDIFLASYSILGIFFPSSQPELTTLKSIGARRESK
ncbi:MAG: hypothetical protein JRJ66_01375 [Deltaproteobacteria bacterium]|nr:hypothetical protein [Deltaproteobacteria bacterium]MBW2299835.1 hypothetical protein [Deltaproteobacteria bacterium]RLB35914.1 MAG: hypothetical protein DRH11_01260 [Deltaproteobacteria bacterium]